MSINSYGSQDYIGKNQHTLLSSSSQASFLLRDELLQLLHSCKQTIALSTSQKSSLFKTYFHDRRRQRLLWRLLMRVTPLSVQHFYVRDKIYPFTMSIQYDYFRDDEMPIWHRNGDEILILDNKLQCHTWMFLSVGQPIIIYLAWYVELCSSWPS